MASVESGTMATTGRARKSAPRMNRPQSSEASAVRAPLATLRAERLIEPEAAMPPVKAQTRLAIPRP